LEEVEEYSSEFSVVLETQWRLSERYLEKAELVIGLGKWAVFEMGLLYTLNQHLKEVEAFEARATIYYEPFDWESKSSEL
jgi:hypothetical protein